MRANNLSCIVTFTAAGKFPERRDALDAVASFLRKKRVRQLVFGTDAAAPYVYVAEPHKSGGWHVHAAIRERFIPYRDVIGLWSRHLASLGYGAVTHRFTVGDPDAARGRRKTHTAKQAAFYIAKYLSKTFDGDGREEYERRFTRSHGFAAVASVQIAQTFEALQEMLPAKPERVFRWADALGVECGFWASG
jgi:hypothetical protein